MAPQIYQIRSDKKRKWLMPIILAAVCLVIAAAVFYFFGYNRSKLEPMVFPFPSDENVNSLDSTAYERESTELYNRINLLLADESEVLWYAWYQLEGRLGEPAAKKSEAILLYDQLIYGQYLLEQADQNAFDAWWQQISDAFIKDDHTLRLMTKAYPANRQSDEASTAGDSAASWQEAFWLVRVLGQSNALWPSQPRLDAWQTISGQLLAILEQQGFTPDSKLAVPTPSPTPDPAATPRPVPDAPENPDLQPRRSVLSLAGLDLFTLRALADLSEAWNPYYEEALLLVENAFITDSLPLYALAYDIDAAQYLYFTDQQQAVSIEPALQTMLHLAEIGQLPAASLAWLREEIFNRGALYTAYHITQGFPVSDQESICGYALTAQIARLTGDQNLYDRAVDRLLWHRATSATSVARGAVFEQNHEELVYVYADQNLWTLRVLQ